MSVYTKNGRRVLGTMVRLDALDVGDAPDQEKARRYAAEPSASFPPIYVVGTKVLDGFHRVAAAKLRGETVIHAEGCPVGGIIVP